MAEAKTNRSSRAIIPRRALAVAAASCAIAFLFGAGWFYHEKTLAKQAERARAATRDYVSLVHRIERGFIESLPIYLDYASPQKEARLRRYLLKDHLEAAARYGIAAVRDEAEIQTQQQAGRLIAVENAAGTHYFFYNVPRALRYLTPRAAQGLEEIGLRFQAILLERARARDKDAPAPPPVKFAISSMLRPASYQSELRGRNANASLNSSHSHGVSFDLFYDEYYVSLPEGAAAHDGPGSSEASSPAEGPAVGLQAALRSRFGFLLGAALRRQFRAVLTETLLQLQDEGLLYAILEKNQRCYHVTILR